MEQKRPDLEALIEQCAALVWKTAAVYLEDTEDVKECVNDVFLEVCQHIGRYDPQKGTFSAWIASIARHKAVSRYRKNRTDALFMRKIFLRPEDRRRSLTSGNGWRWRRRFRPCRRKILM